MIVPPGPAGAADPSVRRPRPRSTPGQGGSAGPRHTTGTRSGTRPREHDLAV